MAITFTSNISMLKGNKKELNTNGSGLSPFCGVNMCILRAYYSTEMER
jgi:hypothetical protein